VLYGLGETGAHAWGRNKQARAAYEEGNPIIQKFRMSDRDEVLGAIAVASDWIVEFRAVTRELDLNWLRDVQIRCECPERVITRRRCPPKARPLRVRDATFVASPRIPPRRTNSRTGPAGDAAAVFLDLEIGQFASKALQHG
jgi:hypothetical protein